MHQLHRGQNKTDGESEAGSDLEGPQSRGGPPPLPKLLDDLRFQTIGYGNLADGLSQAPIESLLPRHTCGTTAATLEMFLDSLPIGWSEFLIGAKREQKQLAESVTVHPLACLSVPRSSR